MMDLGCEEGGHRRLLQKTADRSCPIIRHVFQRLQIPPDLGLVREDAGQSPFRWHGVMVFEQSFDESMPSSVTA
jgi:hypothetical protein